MKKIIWTNQDGQEFFSKSLAYKWLNKAKQTGVDFFFAKLYCDGEKRFSKNPFGTFDHYQQAYIENGLPEEDGVIGSFTY